MKLTNKLKKEQGITLIALVITIVVMLILAGVTINLTLGENGIFTTAQKVAQNYTDAQNKEMVGIESFTSTVDKAVGSIQNNYEIAGTILKTENNINYIADGAGNYIPVPVGFSPIITPEQGTKYTGFVIKNNIDGNEFVWVPVGNIENYQRIAWTREGWEYSQTLDEETGKITRADKKSLSFTETMPIDEQESIEKYGGYYIGRYETGIKGGTLASKEKDGTTMWTGYTGGTLVVQDKQQVWNYITRDKAIEEAEKLYNKELDNVESKLCSSYAWDTALKFIAMKNSKYPTNSIGNYNIETGGTGKVQKTGYYGINNIFDMGGNTWEWTTENASDTDNKYTRRGGVCFDSALKLPAAHRLNTNSTNANDNISFRITLYI